jgi:hypothetical protein
MTILWILLQIIIIFFYKNLNEFNQPTTNANEESGPLIVNISTNYDSIANNSQINNEHNSINLVDNSESGSFLLRMYNLYIREEVVVVYTASFIVFFMQTTLETVKFL